MWRIKAAEEITDDEPHGFQSVSADLERLEFSLDNNEHKELLFDAYATSTPSGSTVTMNLLQPKMRRPGEVPDAEIDDLCIELFRTTLGKKLPSKTRTQRRGPSTFEPIDRWQFPHPEGGRYEDRMFRDAVRIEMLYQAEESAPTSDNVMIFAITLKTDNKDNSIRSKQIWVACKSAFKYMSSDTLSYVNLERPLLANPPSQSLQQDQQDDGPWEIPNSSGEPSVYPGWLSTVKHQIEAVMNGTGIDGEDRQARKKDAKRNAQLAWKKTKTVQKKARVAERRSARLAEKAAAMEVATTAANEAEDAGTEEVDDPTEDEGDAGNEADVVETSEQRWNIEELLDRQVRNNMLGFMVKWEGFEEAKWEPHATLMEDFPTVVQDFEAQNPQASKRRRL